MTMPDLGPERPGQPSETRELVQHRHTEPSQSLSTVMAGRSFWIALLVIAAAIAVFALLLLW
jgi:hypothetical protein